MGTARTAFVGVLLGAWPALACSTCRPAVQAGIFDGHFWGRLSLTLLPLAVTLAVVAVVRLLAKKGAEA